MARRNSMFFAALVICVSSTAWADTLFYAVNSVNGTVSSISSTGVATQVASGLSNPRGITQDQAGNFYATNWAAGPGFGTVTRIDAVTKAVTPIATGLWSPYDITVSTAGHVYFSTLATDGSTSIMKYTPGGSVTTFVDHVGSGANGLVFDPNGNLFACNWGDGTVVKISPAGGITPYASGLGAPNGLALDSDGFVYVDDFNTGRLYKIAQDGSKSIFATGFIRPTDMAYDDFNKCIYLTNWGSDTISKVTLAGQVSTFVAGISAPSAVTMAIPEPDSLAILASGTLLMLGRRRRAGKTSA